MVTVLPLTATGLAVARATELPFTFTVYAVPSGTEVSSRELRCRSV